jgi:DNA repair exonuclease SbcCD ATPase subunit
MITFEKIRWKNFLSTGDQWTEISLNKSSTTLVIGTNGAGKSTMLDALCFALFNKPYRKINKPQLVNSSNEKGCLVEVEFTVGPRKYLIRRGIKPNVFDIIIDGEMRNKEADDRANQKIVEEQILKLNYKSFTQIVILGSSNFVPFMQLTQAHRREVIEDLLDIRIFSAMNNLLKEEIRQSREVIKNLTLKKNNIKDKISMQEGFIEDLENRHKDKIEENENKIEKLISDALETDQQNNSIAEEIKKKEKELSGYETATEKLRKLGSLKGKISQRVTTITKEHKFFSENTVCPTCTQSIEEDFRLNKIGDAQDKAKELQEGFLKLEESIRLEEDRERHFKTLTKEITELTHGISQNNVRIAGFNRQVRDLQHEVQTLTSQLQDRNSEHEKLDGFKNDLQLVFGKLADKNEEVKYNDFAYSLLKDGGVKSKIIKKYLPLINQQVNRYLQMMDFYINFHLDEEFGETIQSPVHDKFTYSSFSEGEKMRIDLALLFAWREVARFKNSANTNLLILDEVFDSSLDTVGTDEFTKIIRFVIQDANTFVISHKADMLDKFNNVIEFSKKGGFSYMSQKSVVES